MLEWLASADVRLIVAGCLGGAVNWLTRKTGPWDGATQIFVGGVCAWALSPLAIPALRPIIGEIVGTPEELARLSGFVIGLGGTSISGFVMDIWVWYRRIKIGGGKADE